MKEENIPDHLSRLDLSRRMRGVRFARIRFRAAWDETPHARDLRRADLRATTPLAIAQT